MSNNLEIEIIEKGRFKILKLKGRIDASWSLRLKEAIDEIIRNGSYNIVLDAADVDYISSAGIRVLLMSYKELKALNGSFAVLRPGENVSSIIKMMGLSAFFDCSEFELEINKRSDGGASASGSAAAGGAAPNYGTINGIDIDVLFKSDYCASVKIIGDMDKIGSFSYVKTDARRLANSSKTIAFGLGALGPDGQNSIESAGEFLSVCGFAAYMPSDGSKKPDYMTASRDFMPEINYLYSAICDCDYSAAFTFKSHQANSRLRFSDIVKTAHDVANRDDILVVIIGEVGGIVGASLSTPPFASNNKPSSAPFGFPQIRDNFNITSEPAYNGHIAICAGISSSRPTPDPAAAKFSRPLASGSILSGHFHAAVFEFMPLKKNSASPVELVAALYEKKEPEAVLHLINDWREVNGAGETEFVNGACWIVNISGYETDMKEKKQ